MVVLVVAGGGERPQAELWGEGVGLRSVQVGTPSVL